MRIWFRIQFINFDADPDFYLMRDAGPGYQNDAVADPQHWLPEYVEHLITVN